MLADSRLSLTEFIAFNDELAAIVRSGLPLEESLHSLGRDVPGRAGQLAYLLAKRLESGESLENALEAEAGRVPEGYRAILLAGQRAGNLPAALERVTDVSREIQELRRTVVVALLYPFFVLLFAYGLFVVFIGEYLRRLHDLYLDMRVPEGRVLGTLVWIADTLWPYAWIPPLVAIAIFALWWPSRRTVLLIPGWLGWGVPFAGQLRRLMELSGFLELLAMLIEHKTPLPESLDIAGKTVSTPRLQNAAASMAEQLRQSRPPQPIWGMPAYVSWLLSQGESTPGLVRSLRSMSDAYRRQAMDVSVRLKFLLPVLAGVGLGAVTVLCYSLILFGPLVQLLRDLAQP